MADETMLVKVTDGSMKELKLVELSDGTYAVAVVVITEEEEGST